MIEELGAARRRPRDRDRLPGAPGARRVPLLHRPRALADAARAGAGVSSGNGESRRHRQALGLGPLVKPRTVDGDTVALRRWTSTSRTRTPATPRSSTWSVTTSGCSTSGAGPVTSAAPCATAAVTSRGLEIDEVAAEKARDALEEVVVADLDTTLRPASTSRARHVRRRGPRRRARAPARPRRRCWRMQQRSSSGTARSWCRSRTSPTVRSGSRCCKGAGHYTDTGLLDATHIRFYTRAGLLAMFADGRAW